MSSPATSRATSPYPSSPATSAILPTTTVSREGSTAPSSPTQTFLDDEELQSEGDEDVDDEKWQKLEPFLDRVTVYAKALKEQMDSAKYTQPARPPASSSTRKRPRHSASDTRASKMSRKNAEADVASSRYGAPAGAMAEEPRPRFTQPVLITGTTLKGYQLEGVAWMVGLYQNGISGILADEMGLGKTLQTISFNAFLRERTPAPFMVVCPLSVLHNWASEYRKFAPEIPVCIYHGAPEERAELRRANMVIPSADREKWWLGDSAAARRSTKGKGKQKGKKVTPTAPRKPPAEKGRMSPGANANVDADEKIDLPPNQKTTFPVVLTTYEMIIKDRDELAKYHWGFVVVDEGHRLKNMECRLIRELKSLNADARMVLTGTPLHNNLAELWSLLNFVLPDVFVDLDTFQEWFSFPTSESIASPRTTKLISTLHAILRPFILRRLKVDVETDLPPKKEYVLYAPLSVRQRELYDAIVDGSLRAMLMKARGTPDPLSVRGKKAVVDEQVDEQVRLDEQENRPKTRSSRKGKVKEKKRYDLDGDDDEYFEKLENGELEHERARERGHTKTAEEIAKEWQYKAQLKKINNMRLQNTVMQLRKVCSHPFLFDWPIDLHTMEPILTHELVTASGKMMLLKQLLDELFKRGHKVLLFSQFTTMLDIVEDWADNLKRWRFCRIDGSTSMDDRQEQVEMFQNGGDKPDAPRLFLLSTRAGGLGLNLTAADTVIFYDQDWNPQMDLQAQDRAHRIGQTKPVLIFRLVTAHTVETKIMQRATEKRKLEALVIAKGKFRAPADAAVALRNGTGKTKAEALAEMAAALLRLEGEHIRVAVEGQSVISAKEMDALLDRRPEVFVGRGKGWTSNKVAGVEGRKVEGKTAFAVYEAPIDMGGDALAGMMGEPMDDE